MSSDSVIMLPPYWFDTENFEHKSLKSRIIELERLRDAITDEINYLKSATANAV